MRAIIFLFLSGLFFDSAAQNLVPNPSFEDTVSCPTNGSQLNEALYWVNPTQASPDYFNVCSTGNFYVVHVPDNGFGFQNTHSGAAYGGFYVFQKGIPNYREYIQTKLTDTLQLNHKYYVSFYVNLTNYSQYSLSNIGAYFSSNPITSTGSLVLNYTPQIENTSIQLSDSVNWMLIEDTLIANGTEEYVTIGNFRNDSQSDTSYIGWFSTNNIAYYYIDDVSVIDVQDLGINEFSKRALQIYPNPTDGKVYVSGFAVSDKVTAVEVIDITGKLVSKQHPVVLNGVIELNLNMNNGVYFIKVLSEGKQNKVEKVIISK